MFNLEVQDRRAGPRRTGGSDAAQEPRALAAACEVGAYLGRSAIWSADRCTWLGDRIMVPEPGVTKVVSERLSPNIYDGQSGIVLFLAALYEVTRDPVTAELCRAALRHMSAVEDQKTSGYLGGFYVGWPGTGYAFWRAGRSLKDGELARRGLSVLRRAASEHLATGSDAMDLLSGAAGTLLLALYLYESDGDDAWLAWAERCGTALLETRQAAATGVSWPMNSGRPGLLGLSHGNAGIVLALAKLRTYSDELVPIAVIHQALAYERHWFDHKRKNWPDLRSGSEDAFHKPSMMAWCHGAPGVMLARAALIKYLPDSECRKELAVAIDATEQDFGRQVVDRMNHCYCHGLAGNAEAYLTATDEITSWDTSRSSISRWSVSHLNQKVAPANRSPRDGCYGLLAYSPALFLGSAGLGYFYLRLATYGRVPSILLPPGSFG